MQQFDECKFLVCLLHGTARIGWYRLLVIKVGKGQVRHYQGQVRCHLGQFLLYKQMQW